MLFHSTAFHFFAPFGFFFSKLSGQSIKFPFYSLFNSLIKRHIEYLNVWMEKRTTEKLDCASFSMCVCVLLNRKWFKWLHSNSFHFNNVESGRFFREASKNLARNKRDKKWKVAQKKMSCDENKVLIAWTTSTPGQKGGGTNEWYLFSMWMKFAPHKSNTFFIQRALFMAKMCFHYEMMIFPNSTPLFPSSWTAVSNRNAT